MSTTKRVVPAALTFEEPPNDQDPEHWTLLLTQTYNDFADAINTTPITSVSFRQCIDSFSNMLTNVSRFSEYTKKHNKTEHSYPSEDPSEQHTHCKNPFTVAAHLVRAQQAFRTLGSDVREGRVQIDGKRWANLDKDVKVEVLKGFEECKKVLAAVRKL